jgi:hypothetical protein
MDTEEEAFWEDVKMTLLRDIVDGAAKKLRRGRLTPEQTELLLEDIRNKALALFPDKGNVYDLIYDPRFRRIMDETGSEFTPTTEPTGRD